MCLLRNYDIYVSSHDKRHIRMLNISLKKWRGQSEAKYAAIGLRWPP